MGLRMDARPCLRSEKDARRFFECLFGMERYKFRALKPSDDSRCTSLMQRDDERSNEGWPRAPSSDEPGSSRNVEPLGKPITDHPAAPTRYHPCVDYTMDH